MSSGLCVIASKQIEPFKLFLTQCWRRNKHPTFSGTASSSSLGFFLFGWCVLGVFSSMKALNCRSFQVVSAKLPLCQENTLIYRGMIIFLWSLTPLYTGISPFPLHLSWQIGVCILEGAFPSLSFFTAPSLRLLPWFTAAAFLHQGSLSGISFQFESKFSGKGFFLKSLWHSFGV